MKQKDITHSKMFYELKKAKTLMDRYNYPPSDIFKQAVEYCLNALNFFISAEMDKNTNIDTEFFYLSEIIDSKRKYKEMIETYFYLKSLSNKSYSMISKNTVLARNWKQSIHLTKQDIIQIINKVENLTKTSFTS